MKACVPVRKENIEAIPDPSEFSCFLKGRAKGSLGEFVDGPYVPNSTVN